MNILHLSFGALPSPYADSGGALQRRVRELSCEQAARGHNVRVLVAERFDAEKRIGGVDVRFVRSRLGSPWLHLEHQIRSLLAAGRGRRPDVIHVHNEPEAALIGRRLRIPTVLHYDNYFFRGHDRLFAVYRRALQAFDALLPVSAYCAEESLKWWKLSPERSIVVPNGVNIERFSPDPAAAAEERRHLGLHGAVILLYVGRVCEQKGTDILLSAFREVRRRHSDAHLLVAGPIEQFGAAGDGLAADRWRTDMDRAGARYLGLVPEDRLVALMSLADVFVMPTTELEMQGMAALEAQACGTPVIASDHGGLPETVPDGCGLRFAPRDIDGLTRAIERLLADRAERDALGRKARVHARGLSWGRVADRLEEAYRFAGRPR